VESSNKTLIYGMEGMGFVHMSGSHGFILWRIKVDLSSILNLGSGPRNLVIKLELYS